MPTTKPSQEEPGAWPPSGDWSHRAVAQGTVLTSENVYRSVCSLCIVWGSCQCKRSNEQGIVQQDRQELSRKA